MDFLIRAHDLDLDDTQRGDIERRLIAALDRFERRIARVVVRVRDINGPRGGIDKECHVAVKLASAGELFVEERGDDLRAVVAKAADRAAEAVRRAVSRKKRGIGAG